MLLKTFYRDRYLIIYFSERSNGNQSPLISNWTSKTSRTPALLRDPQKENLGVCTNSYLCRSSAGAPRLPKPPCTAIRPIRTHTIRYPRQTIAPRLKPFISTTQNSSPKKVPASSTLTRKSHKCHQPLLSISCTSNQPRSIFDSCSAFASRFPAAAASMRGSSIWVLSFSFSIRVYGALLLYGKYGPC